MRALLIAIAVLAAGYGVAAAQSPAAPAPPAARPPQRTISLSRMGLGDDGQAVAEFQFGFACVTDRKVRLDSGRFSDSRFTRAFRDAMSSGGFRMTAGGGGGGDLFPGSSPSADLQVGALIQSLHLRTCTKAVGLGSRNTEGEATVDVEWQIYSPEEGKVIGRLHSSGEFRTDAPADDILDRLLTGAFRRAADDLARKQAFSRLVRGDTAKTVSAAAPAVPLTPMSINVPAPHGTAIAQAPFAVVSVVVSDGHGSGVLVSPDGYILTNHHVAGGSGKVRVIWSDGSESQGEVLRADRKRDVALIKVEAARARPLTIRRDPPLLGDTVFAIGTPLDKQFSGTLTKGIVSAMRMTDGQPFIQSDVAINHGNSGGALLDEKGQLVGLTESGIFAGEAPVGINFFIPIDDALKVLQVTPVALAAATPAIAPRKAAPATSRRRP